MISCADFRVLSIFIVKTSFFVENKFFDWLDSLSLRIIVSRLSAKRAKRNTNTVIMSTQSSFSKWYRFVDLSSLKNHLTRWIMFIRQLNYLLNDLNCCSNDNDEFNDYNYLSNNLNCCLNDDDEFNDNSYLRNSLNCCLNDDDEFNDDNYLRDNLDCCLNDDDEFNDQWSISKIFDEKTTMSSLLLNRLIRQTCKTNVQKEKLFMKRSC
jgi:hypothetical protein